MSFVVLKKVCEKTGETEDWVIHPDKMDEVSKIDETTTLVRYKGIKEGVRVMGSVAEVRAKLHMDKISLYDLQGL